MYLVHAARTVKATNKTACTRVGASLFTTIIFSTHEYVVIDQIGGHQAWAKLHRKVLKGFHYLTDTHF